MSKIPIIGPQKGFALRFREALSEARPEPVKIAQPPVAETFGVSTTTARKWLTGTALPSMTNAVAIAERLGVCVEWLLTGRGPKHPLTALEDGPAEVVAAWPTMNDYQKAAIQALIRPFPKPA